MNDKSSNLRQCLRILPVEASAVPIEGMEASILLGQLSEIDLIAIVILPHIQIRMR